MKNRFIESVVLFFISTGLAAQLPDTDIWLFGLERSKENIYTLKKPVNITARAGYDNQPSFSEDGRKIYYTSIREDGQADIYSYSLSKKKTTRITSGPESEYSPTPYAEGILASVVVEQDSSQRIHFIDELSGAHTGKLENDSVGYFTFLNKDTVAFYKLTSPHSLRYTRKSDPEEKWLGNSPSRAFRSMSRHSILYALKDTAATSFFIYDLLTAKGQKVCVVPGICEDFLFHPVFGIVRSEGAKLLRYDEKQRLWILLFDLAPHGIKKITRFAFNRNDGYLAVVNNL
jgi:hypothetical protein